MSDDEDFVGLDEALFGEERVNHGGPNAPPVLWECEGFPSLSLEVSSSSSTLLMAHHVWQSSMTLGSVLAKRELEKFGVVIDETKCVVELGAGAALPSLVCDKILHACKTIATDYPDKNVVEAMERNAKNNGCSERLRVVGYDWGGDPNVVLKELDGLPIDVILAADTLWMEKYHSLLLKAIQALAPTSSTSIVFSYMHHDNDGRTANSFFKQLEAAGFLLVHESTRDWRKRGGGQTSKLEYGDVFIRVYKRRI